MTARSDILDAITAKLIGQASGVGGRVYRSRTVALKRDKLPAVIVMPAGEEVSEPTNAGSDRLLKVTVEVHARGDLPDDIVEPIISSIVAALLSDPSLGGRAIDVGEIGTEWSFDEGDGAAGVATITFAVLYRTARNAT